MINVVTEAEIACWQIEFVGNKFALDLRSVLSRKPLPVADRVKEVVQSLVNYQLSGIRLSVDRFYEWIENDLRERAMMAVPSGEIGLPVRKIISELVGEEKIAVEKEKGSGLIKLKA